MKGQQELGSQSMTDQYKGPQNIDYPRRKRPKVDTTQSRGKSRSPNYFKCQAYFVSWKWGFLSSVIEINFVPLPNWSLPHKRPPMAFSYFRMASGSMSHTELTILSHQSPSLLSLLHTLCYINIVDLLQICYISSYTPTIGHASPASCICPITGL